MVWCGVAAQPQGLGTAKCCPVLSLNGVVWCGVAVQPQGLGTAKCCPVLSLNGVVWCGVAVQPQGLGTARCCPVLSLSGVVCCGVVWHLHHRDWEQLGTAQSYHWMVWCGVAVQPQGLGTARCCPVLSLSGVV